MYCFEEQHAKYKFTPKLLLQLRGSYGARSSAYFVGKRELFVCGSYKNCISIVIISR